MEIGVLYLSHAMLVLAELIVCSTRGLACILAKWFWPTVMSLSLTYGSPEASCIKRADTYFGRRSAGHLEIPNCSNLTIVFYPLGTGFTDNWFYSNVN